MVKIREKIRELLGLAYYESPLDQFLKAFNKTHPKLSPSQKAEVEKYERIYRLRDNPMIEKIKKIFWDKF